jgi:hypothetical protein
MGLREDILADPACATALAARDCIEMARIRSIGRTRANAREIGNGTILETLGIAAGNALLDEINTNASYRYVKPLVEQGRLLIGAALVQATVQSMVPAVLTQAQADTLCALGKEPDPLTLQEVGDALYYPDGSDR